MTELLMALAGMLTGLMALLGVPALLLFLVAPLMGALPWLSDLG